MEVKDQLSDEDFIKKNPEERDLILFKKLEEVSGQVATLLASPWRLSIPIIKWVVVGIVALVAILFGYGEMALKFIITVVG